MRRRELLGALTAALLCGPAAMARDRSDDILRELKRSGYEILDVSRTFLGRVRILAARDGGRREIILNPNTGEILRDLWVARGEDKPGGTQGWDDPEDDDDDDKDDDDTDDDSDDDGDDGDNSGSGGGGGGDDDGGGGDDD